MDKNPHDKRLFSINEVPGPVLRELGINELIWFSNKTPLN